MKAWIAAAATLLIAINVIVTWGTTEVWGWLSALAGWVPLTFHEMDRRHDG